MSYSEYQRGITLDVTTTIAKLHCQPVLFVGAGASRRYFNAPSWNELLSDLANDCPLIEQDYAYYAQSCGSAKEIGKLFAEKYREWAWTTGRNLFPDSMFNPDTDSSSYIKYLVAQKIKSVTPTNDVTVDHKLHNEIQSLKKIRPHAVLTTNYDTFLENIFPDFEVIVGQAALRGMPFALGEIFKFHGCVNDIEQIVFTSDDYQEFDKKKKFIAARLLSLFNEHPMLIMGYGVNDSSICALLSDIDESLATPGSLIDNIYFLEYNPDAENQKSLPTERLIQIEDNRSVRVKTIIASDFNWVFEAFSSPETLHSVPVRFMRAILARSYELVRKDIHRKPLNVNFEFLQSKLDNSDEFAELFGITTIAEGSISSAIYKYSITELGKKLGGNTWHPADKLFKIIKRDTGQDLKTFDSKFHSKQRLNRSTWHLYSDEALHLLIKVQGNNRCDPDWLL